MYKEFKISIGSEIIKVFLNDEPYTKANEDNFHMHNYAEVHIVTGGDATFRINSSDVCLKSGNILVIPCWNFHRCTSVQKNTLHSSFQVKIELPDFMILNIGNEMCMNFFNEITQCIVSQDYRRVSSYISLFVSLLPGREKLEAKNVSDYSFLLREFFSHHYASNDISLTDLANKLSISERQAERLVNKHTALTFKEELQRIRMNVAKHLLETTNMNLTDIAQKVGYKSYSGFWRAMKKHKLL